MPAKDRSHYTGTYQARARHVRDAAYADPTTPCWRCGRTLAQHRIPHPTLPWTPTPRWHAGHTIDANSNAPLAPEANCCNTTAGQRSAHTVHHEPHSRTW